MVDDFEDFFKGKAGVPKTLVKPKPRLHSLYFPQNTFMLTESRGEFSDLHSIFSLRALRFERSNILKLINNSSILNKGNHVRVSVWIFDLN